MCTKFIQKALTAEKSQCWRQAYRGQYAYPVRLKSNPCHYEAGVPVSFSVCLAPTLRAWRKL